MGRIIYSCINDSQFIATIQEMLEKKLNAIKMPNFMEEVSIKNVELGQTAPIFENIIPPVCDERGLWFEADCSYDGLMHITISTKLNLMRLKKQERKRSGRKSAERAEAADDSDSSDDN